MLDFSKRKKRYFDFKLHDETLLSLPVPTLGMFDNMLGAIDTATGAASYDSLRKVLFDILSSNRQRVVITDEHIMTFDLDEIIELLLAYTAFTNEVAADPNLQSLTTPARRKR
ncbi:MAG: hypothetical protein ACOX6L_12090 [Syntrophomonadaceae bacterium]|jgi:hypothetical protein